MGKLRLTDVHNLSEVIQPVNTILCCTNAFLHVYPVSGPEPGPEGTTEINEAFALSELMV